MGDLFYRRAFLIGALWNVVGGASILVATPWIFWRAGLSPPVPRVYYDAWVALFMTFGIGYYMVYESMYANKNIVMLGIIGKVAFAAIFVYGLWVLKAQVPMFFVIPVVGDLVFVVLFLMFLNYAKRAGR